MTLWPDLEANLWTILRYIYDVEWLLSTYLRPQANCQPTFPHSNLLQMR